MPIVLILFLMLVCSPLPWPSPQFGLGTPGIVAITVALALVPPIRAWRIGRRAALLFADPIRRSESIALANRGRSRQALWVIGTFVLALTVGGWGWLIRSQLPTLPGAELILLAPFFASWVLSWFGNYRFEQHLNEFIGRPQFGIRQYLTDSFRQQLALVLLPLGLIVAEQSAMRLIPDMLDSWWFRVASIGGIVGILIVSPWLLRLALGLRSMPIGPLRDRMEAGARRLAFRCSDFLVWDTRGFVANAMVAGLLPVPRYVLFTDRLIDELTPDEIEVVLGHEVGHIKAHHLPLYAAFLTLSLLTLTGLANGLDRFLDQEHWFRTGFSWLGDWATVPNLLVSALYIFVGFGFLSRRCEREADLYGTAAIPDGGVQTFINALERVATINGISRSKPGWLSSWQHGTIAQRVAFLERVRDDPSLDGRYRRRLRWLKIALLTGLASAVAVLWYAGLVV